MRASALNARKKEKRDNSFLHGAGIWVIITVIAADQLSKAAISHYIPLNQTIPLIRNILSLTLVHNTGAAFGILRDQTILFIIIPLVALPAIFFSFKERGGSQNGLTQLALSLVSAGAIGNLIDRVAWGYVIDFLDFHVWPVFNVADSAITIGAVLLGYSLLRAKK